MSDREAARDILRELLEEALGRTNGHGVVPQIPPPPVAAVHRPSTWSRPPEGAEVIGGAAPAATAGAEAVALETDADLDRFVRALLARGPEEHRAILAGRLRFTLAGGAGGGRAGASPGGATPGVVRVARGAVTERTVQDAAKAGARLVLGRGAVLTPLAREKARAKGIEIERE
jgi:hypothetical protein